MSPRAYFVGPNAGINGSSSGPSRYAPASATMSSSWMASQCLSRAEHYDVVIEGEGATAILSHLGAIVLDQTGNMEGGEIAMSGGADTVPRSASSSSITAIQKAESSSTGLKQSAESAERFESMLEELVQTERSYVRRIDTLYKRYALPLRQLARDRDTAIIPLYEAQRLFGNIGEVVGANTAFLRDLEKLLQERKSSGSCTNLGELLYRHVTCFSCYNEYFNNFEKAKHIEQTMTKGNRAYREFVDRTKASTPGLGNVGLRELIMEPVQRIPRYTMLLGGLVRHMPATDPARGRLEEAIVLASRIASCEVDDKTKRAAVHWSFARNVDGFPAGLISVHRQFIDCIDVDDFPIDVLGPAAMSHMLSSPGNSLHHSTSSPGQRTLHCSLFLFDDVIAITKRASPSSCGRFLVGLDDLNRLADQMKSFTERSSLASKINQKIELGFRGLIDLNDVRAVDIGGPDFQLSMARAPSHITGEKWASRFVRQYATMDVSSISGPDPALARSEKQRFLDNLWRAQALLKARDYRSHVRNCVIPSRSEEDKIRRVIYWNIYARRNYLPEPHKSLAVLHVDPNDEADCLPFGYENTPPAAIMRIHDIDLDEGQCYFTMSLRPGIEDSHREEPIRQANLGDIASRLYDAAATTSAKASSDFAPSNSPSTPASSHRGRALATGLEQFGRSLFGTPNSLRSNGTGSDLFGAKRTRSKGSSSYASRNGSTSTRLTQSTAATSSIGSRDMLRSQRLDVPCVNGVKQSLVKYRQQGGSGGDGAEEEVSEEDVDRNTLTPRRPDDSISPTLQRTQSSPSPKRKPVPQMEEAAQPQGTASASKRTLPLDASPSSKPSKRIASEVSGISREEELVEQETRLRSVSPSPPERYPSGPRAMQDVFRPEGVAPLRVRKDGGQAKALNREEKVQRTWKDLELLRQGIVNSRRTLQQIQLWASDNKLEQREMQDCLLGQENDAEVLLRLRDNLSELLEDVKPAASISCAPSKPVAPLQESKDDVESVRKLQAQVSTLQRKCELLSALEKDGRLENTELHRAFNEELDLMYQDANLGGNEQIAQLRSEVKRTKRERNEANIENKSLQRELALEKAQGEVWKALLETNGLI